MSNWVAEWGRELGKRKPPVEVKPRPSKCSQCGEDILAYPIEEQICSDCYEARIDREMKDGTRCPGCGGIYGCDCLE